MSLMTHRQKRLRRPLKALLDSVVSGVDSYQLVSGAISGAASDQVVLDQVVLDQVVLDQVVLDQVAETQEAIRTILGISGRM
jgi:hypothetical protein